MQASTRSALSRWLAIAVLCLTSSCASFGRAPTPLTPRSESVCDQAPPSPVPPIADGVVEAFAAFREVLGLYRDEILKDGIERRCRAGVRAENAAAAKAAR